MALRIAMSDGTRIKTIQAPSRNLVTAKTSATIAVMMAPAELMTILVCQPASYFSVEPASLSSRPGSRWPIFHQRRAMPACDRVKERNTPMAYSGISSVTLALKMMISRQATSARTAMPRE